MLLAVTLLQFTNTILVLIFLFLAFRFFETNWSYKISKPYAWEEAVRRKIVSKKLKTIERFYRDKVRFYSIWFQVERLKNESVSGAFVEVGVYKGETARMIHEMDPLRPFHLFDTFSGFDKKDLDAETSDYAGHALDFSDTSLESVVQKIDGNQNIVIHKGYFPETTRNLPDSSYAFVHLDADLYQPTLAGLLYFYPRLSPGGVIMIHDYNHTWEGVTKAVDEFMGTIVETKVEISDWQGTVMIIKSKS